MSMLSEQTKELRLMGDGQADKGEFTVATLLREAADTIEGLRDRLQAAELGSGTCEWLPVESCHAFAGPGWECSNCGYEVGEYEHDFYNCCPICCAKVMDE